jgi:3-oxoacyl-[acyl-carrier protein] reductase
MLRQHSGRIINISSIWGKVGASCEVVYSASKAGIIGFTKALAKETALSGVRVNCIAPGVVDTKMNARFTPEELAEVGELVSPDSAALTVMSFINGKMKYSTGRVSG